MKTTAKCGVTFLLSKGKEITSFKKVQGNFLLQIQKVASTFRKGAGLHLLRRDLRAPLYTLPQYESQGQFVQARCLRSIFPKGAGLLLEGFLSAQHITAFYIMELPLRLKEYPTTGTSLLGDKVGMSLDKYLGRL